jgi:sensor histidine kinase regulating citrate/malate metabolism
MSVTLSEQMQGWQRDEIVRLLEERNVSFRAAARILAILDEQPMPAMHYGNQTETARELRKWTDE